MFGFILHPILAALGVFSVLRRCQVCARGVTSQFPVPNLVALAVSLFYCCVAILSQGVRGRRRGPGAREAVLAGPPAGPGRLVRVRQPEALPDASAGSGAVFVLDAMFWLSVVDAMLWLGWWIFSFHVDALFF